MDLKDTLSDVLDRCDGEMCKRLAATLKPGDLTVRANECLTMSLAVIRQLGMVKTALVLEEYLTGGKLQ